MKNYFLTIIAGLLALSLAGCENMKKQDVGVVTGGAAGALIGSQFGGGSGRIVGAAIGAVGGALIGGSIGRSMDKTDQMYAMQAVSSNQSRSWRNPHGDYYHVQPTRTYHDKAHNRYCREYQTTAVINGQRQRIYGHACRQPDGRWTAM